MFLRLLHSALRLEEIQTFVEGNWGLKMYEVAPVSKATEISC